MNQKQKDIVTLALKNLGREFGTSVEPITAALAADEAELVAARAKIKKLERLVEILQDSVGR